MNFKPRIDQVFFQRDLVFLLAVLCGSPWTVATVTADPLELQSNPVAAGTITVALGDEDRSDWDDIPRYPEDDIDSASPNNYFQVQVANTETSLYFRFEMEDSEEFAFRHNVYVDTDQDRGTGFLGTGDGFLAIGAEYLIQGGSVFRFNAPQQTLWGWEWIEDAVWDATPITDIELAISRSAIGSPDAFDFLMNASNFDLGLDEDFYPETSLSPEGDYFTYEFGVAETIGIDELTAAVKTGAMDSRYDLNGDGSVDGRDREYWVVDISNTYFGDANLDGEFNSRDFVVVFQAGEYEDDVPENSVWSTGDWNGDCEFGSSDLVTAFQSDGFEQGPRTSLAATVPEPHGLAIVILGSSHVLLTRRSRRRGLRAIS